MTTISHESMAIPASFRLLREQEIAELSTMARLYRHVPTGAEVLSLENDDENKVFGITFRTPPPDATGVAHILEHSVLCGSRKYPLKEPFVELIKGSMNTFLNAFTFPDKTCYPVASQNMQDFYNLIDVYLDAVFYPRLTRHTFEQEGWRYELKHLDDDLTMRGIVFNEMKGAYSSPDGMLSDYAQHSLFPDTPYGVDSGGDPKVIPDLTHAQLTHFHETYYHPSNARIYFYGDDDPVKRLHLIEEYLKDFQPIAVPSAVALQQPFEAPVRKDYFHRIDPESPDQEKSRITMNWLLPETADPRTLLALTILDHILVGTPGAPLRKALLDSGLGEDVAGPGYVSYLRQGFFSIGLKGIAAGAANKVEALILGTLDRLATEGIDRADIAAAVNTVEFRLRENNTGGFPRGLVAMIAALTSWLHDGDPFVMLAFEQPLTAIKTRLAEGVPYFENMIHEHFLSNPHRTTTLLQPDPQLGEREDTEERERLARVRAGLGPEELQALVENTHLLEQLQTTPDSPEALATIPGLTLDDLDRHNKHIPLADLQRQETRVLYHDLPTRGIFYLDLALDLHTLPQELLPYIPLFGQALIEMGTTDEDYVQLAQRIGRQTGGIRAHELSTNVRGAADAAVRLVVRGKATYAQVPNLMAILRDVLLKVRLDNKDRFRQMALEARSELEAAMVPAGHRMANRRLRSFFNEADWVAEQFGGISQLFFLRQLLNDIDADWPTVLAKLQQIWQTLVNRRALIANVTLDEQNWQQGGPHLDELLAALPNTPAATVPWAPAYSAGFEGFTVPAPVNYVAKGTNLYQLGYTLHASAAVVANYLRTTWLWERVRMRGGAYGGFCTFDHRSGVFSYLSYRDPNLLPTLDVYDQTSTFLRGADLSGNEVTRSIIGTISGIDSYQLPDAKGYSSLVYVLTNETEAVRQQFREEVLGTTADHFRAFADVLDQVREQGVVVVLGSGEAIEKANAERAGLLRRVDLL